MVLTTQQLHVIEHGPFRGLVVGGELDGWYVENATPTFKHGKKFVRLFHPDTPPDDPSIDNEEYRYNEGAWYLIEKG